MTKAWHSLLNHGQAQTTSKLLILGASVSVGSTAIRFLERNSSIELTGVSVHSDTARLGAILRKFPMQAAGISSEDHYDRAIEKLRAEFPGVVFFRGNSGLVELTQHLSDRGTDTVLTAVVGACGISPTICAIRAGMKIALANKETLVTAGPAISHEIEQIRAKGGKLPVILPVDSEHNAVFQLLLNVSPSHLQRVILTASGGPFRDLPVEKLKSVTREEVLSHPTWKMGPKITVDSAGMVNKGLEIIEAHFLFGLPYDDLDVLIHRHSVAHALVGTKDGGYLICASQPDMIFPIAHTLMYPESPDTHAEASSPETWPSIGFEKVDPAKYPGYEICVEAGRRGGTVPAIFNAANEIAVKEFLGGNMKFTDIPGFLRKVLEAIPSESGHELELFLEADRKSRGLAVEIAGSFSYT